MDAVKMLKKIKHLINLEGNSKTTELEEVKTADGAVIYADKFEPGEAVFIVEGEERIALPVGEYELEDGRMLTVEEEGIIAAITEADGEEAPAEEEPPAEEAPVEAEGELTPEMVEAIRAIVQEEIAAMMAGVEELKSQLTATIEGIETELSKEPADKAPKPNPKGRFARERDIEKKYGTGRPLTAQEKIYLKLYGGE